MKCTLNEYKEINAIKFCPECRIYMCNKCDNYNSSPIFKNHNTYNITKEEEIFTGFCKEKNHFNKLEYFCQNHNQLCCVTCLCKLNEKGEGQHKDCDVYYIEKIKEEKKYKLKENIKCLEKLFSKFNESMETLKNIFENIDKEKENLKLEIQKIFTKIRNTINNREDELLLSVDIFFNEKYFNEELIQKGKKLPKQIKVSLEKGKLIDKEWTDDNNLNSYINDCIDLENNINDINVINESINKCNINNKIKIFFSPKENQLEKFLKKIKSFGRIYYYNYNTNYNNNSKNIKEGLENDLPLININETMICDYPFQDDKLNHSTSKKWKNYFSFGKDNAYLTKYKKLKCINTNGLLGMKKNIDLNRDWILSFEYCKIDWTPVDWNHIFSFGTHINYGGMDDSYYVITLETKPRDGIR